MLDAERSKTCGSDKDGRRHGTTVNQTLISEFDLVSERKAEAAISVFLLTL